MAIDERNFRSTYYEKVGFKNVEEKRSLEILLKEKQVDLTKLKQFCLRFGVPACHRNLVWNLLLGVIPTQDQCLSFVIAQRKEEFWDLRHAVEVLNTSQNITREELFVAMYVLQAEKLPFNLKIQSEKNLTSIVQAMMSYFDSDLEIYWLLKAFYETVQKFQPEVPKLIERSLTLLEKEDSKLHARLSKIGALETLPLREWFDCCFAGIIDSASLARIWDKVASGSYKILVYTTVAILTTLKHRLMTCKSAEEVFNNTQNISEDVSEGIVNKSMEMWQQHGSPLTIYDKPKP